MSTLLLPRMGILSYLEDEALATMSAYGTEFPFNPGDIIIRQGDAQGQLYFVVSGQVQALADVKGKEVVLADIGAGECFGEVSIFEPGPASATVKGLTQGTLWFTDSDNLQAYLGSYPHEACAVILGICQLLSRRLKQANETIKANQILPPFLSIRSRLKNR